MKKHFGGVLLGLLLGFSLSMTASAAIDLNKATQSELEAVKGLGPVKAKAIMAYRDKHGVFKSLDELSNVKGMGKATIEKLKGELAVGSGSPAANKK